MSLELSCRGAGDSDLANITNIGVECSLVLGVPRRTDGSRSAIIEPRSNWSIPIHSCASAAKATIKTVDFRYNGTQGLDSLFVDDIRDKHYDQDDGKPLWGVENTALPLRDVQPLWGLVTDRYRGREDISVLQHDSLWLPGFSEFPTPPYTVMNLPAVELHTDAFLTAYGVTTANRPIVDYTGETNVAMYRKWQHLSANASTMGAIVDSIWTDNVANAVVGTRGWTEKSDGSGHEKRADVPSKDSVDVPVNVFRHRVRYHWAYGIPAYIAVGVCVIIAITAVVLSIFGNAKPSVVRKHIFHTAVGRIMASFNYPGQAHPHAETRFWKRTVGGKKVTMANLVPQPTETVATPQFSNQPINNMEDPLILTAPMVSPTVRPAEGLRARTHDTSGGRCPSQITSFNTTLIPLNRPFI